jgi:hypothetical protein
MPYLVETQDLPTFPGCTVRGHDDELKYIQTIVQQGTGNKAYILECSKNERHRFFYIPDVWERIHTMAHMTKPRWGWKANV